MDLRSERKWKQAFIDAGFVDVEQGRIRVPEDEATEAFRMTVGSLLTYGRRDSA